VYSKYTSKNIAAVLIALFKDYRIIGNLGYFIADNADANNTYINAILWALYLKMLVKSRKGRYLYCFGHITNLYT